MNKKSIYIYFSMIFTLCIPAPGRFACGIILVAEMLLLTLSGAFIRDVIKKLGLIHTGTVVLLVMLVSIVVLLRQVLAFFAPVLALQLGFVMYLPAVSTFMLGFMFDEKEAVLHETLSRNMLRAFRYALFALAFFLFRDIVGFGTITFPTLHRISEKVLFDSNHITLLTFFATIPGALVCAATILIFYAFVARKITIIENAEGGMDMEAVGD